MELENQFNSPSYFSLLRWIINFFQSKIQTWSIRHVRLCAPVSYQCQSIVFCWSVKWHPMLRLFCRVQKRVWIHWAGGHFHVSCLTLDILMWSFWSALVQFVLFVGSHRVSSAPSSVQSTTACPHTCLPPPTLPTVPPLCCHKCSIQSKDHWQQQKIVLSFNNFCLFLLGVSCAK